MTYIPKKLHKCWALKCDKLVPGSMTFCEKHYFMLPEEIRDSLAEAFKKGGYKNAQFKTLRDAAVDFLDTMRADYADRMKIKKGTGGFIRT